MVQLKLNDKAQMELTGDDVVKGVIKKRWFVLDEVKVTEKENKETKKEDKPWWSF